ncbi:hypothetical protein C8A00DRAFT_44713 [Chaetomidium leptoderma]|uniref:Uncharacterized protein n=1 Tax=Chaetomidium leptoderma TaxID=669021 RepID=A0AAN6ZVW2_9PEZI|nr:hypothetical protein C8A00DRAFT_44713 [Chaetomidium leptoderma]
MLTHLDPIPSYEESQAAPRPNALQILGATWGGVTVTADLISLVGDSDRLVLELRKLHTTLKPDPAPGKVKVLTVLYRFDDDGDLETRLLVAAEDSQPSKVVLARGGHAAAQQQQQPHSTTRFMNAKLERPWRAGPQGEVEILALVYGPKRIETSSVLSVLGNYFEGRWGQVRMTNAFFGPDPWPYKVKSWTVYFRFVGSKRVQVVTGWEDGALEVPWSRH